MVILPLVSEEEVEVVDVVDIETIVQCICPLEVHTVCRTSCSRSFSKIRLVARERLAETCGVREVDTELRLEGKVLIKVHLCKYSREHLVFLVSQRVVLKPFKRILALAFPCTVIDRCKRSVSLVRIPVREHEP